MNIAKTAVKLNRFKNLIATTLSTSVFFTPVLTTSLIFSQTSIEPNLNSPLGVILIGGGIILQVATGLVALIQADDNHPRWATSPFFWKKVLDKKFKSGRKKENEKILLTLRELGNNDTTPLQKESLKYIASLLVEAKINAPYEFRWREIVEKTDKYVSGPDFDRFTKQRMVSDRLDLLSKNQSSTHSLLNSVVSETLQSYLHQHPSENTLLLNDWEKEVNKADYTHSSHVYEERAKFLFQYGYELNETDYQALEKIFQKEQDKALISIMDILTASRAQIDWIRIATFMDTYSADDRFFKTYSSTIKQIAGKHTEVVQQQKIVARVEETTKTATQPSDNTLSNTQTKQETLLESEKELNDYLKFQPTHFVEKWDEIKKGYQFVQEHKAELDSFDIIGFMVSLQSSLGVLITSDKAVGRLPTIPVDYQAKAKKLLADNLNLTLEQIHQIQATVGERHLKVLEVHKNYQTAKMGK